MEKMWTLKTPQTGETVPRDEPTVTSTMEGKTLTMEGEPEGV